MSALADGLLAAAERGRVRDRAVGRDGALRRFDWTLAAAALALCGLGALLVWSATRGPSDTSRAHADGYLLHELVNITVGLLAAGIVTAFGLRRLRTWAPVGYLLGCLGLVAVLTPLGSTINGSHSWILLGGGFEVQPSEFAKVALVVIFAVLLGERRERGAASGPGHRAVVGVLALGGVPMGLVLLQPDLGTATVLAFVVLGMIATSGAPARWVLLLVLAGGLGAAAGVQLHLLKPYQVNRFTAFADPRLAPQGFGYNANQARLTVASGGLTGTGLLHGPQTNGQFVPEQQTDFIFTVAGEELGFLGAGGIVLLVGVVLWRGLRIAGRTRDPVGGLICVGVVCWFAFQAFENIGMTVGLTPITGLPLPFLSYGGSSMVADLVAVGLLETVALSAPSRFSSTSLAGLLHKP